MFIEHPQYTKVFESLHVPDSNVQEHSKGKHISIYPINNKVTVVSFPKICKRIVIDTM